MDAIAVFYFFFAVIKMLSSLHAFILSFTKGYFNCKHLHFTIQIIGSIAAVVCLCFSCLAYISDSSYSEEIEGHVVAVLIMLIMFDMNFFVIANILSYVVICASKPPSSAANYVECPPLVFAPIPPPISIEVVDN